MMRTLLNMMNESDPWGGVSVHLHQIDLTNRIEKAEPGSAVGSDERLKKFGDQYLKVLDDDRTRFLDRVGDAGGGQYVINVKVWSLNKWLVYQNSCVWIHNEMTQYISPSSQRTPPSGRSGR